MRAAVFLALPLAVAVACNLSGGTGPGGTPIVGEDGGEDGALPAALPDHNACSGTAASCLSGTATTQSLAAPQRFVANLYEMFPLAGATPVARQEVAKDGTWAFSGLSSSAHYYVYVVAVYGEAGDGGGGSSIAATVGPLTVPSSGQPVDVVVQPVQLSVLESSVAGGALDVRSALAYVFDPATGAPSTGGDAVSIVLGGTPVPMPWTEVAPSQYGYYATFSTATPAQPTYTITTPGGSWQLVATTPTFTPSLTAPADGATVPAGQDLLVSWTAEPAADEELVYLYTQASGGTWTPVNASPPPQGPGVTQTTVPGSEVVAGSLLVGAAFVVGSCPASADGCVVSEAVANAQITAQ